MVISFTKPGGIMCIANVFCILQQQIIYTPKATVQQV